MSQSINGYPRFSAYLYDEIPSFSKYTQIANPVPGRCFVFIETHQDAIVDTQFGIPVAYMESPDMWWDFPANRHNQGCNFSFADGHVEHWRWRAPMIFTAGRGNEQAVTPQQIPDYQRIETGFLQNFGLIAHRAVPSPLRLTRRGSEL